jgi:hypothetical protein
MRLDVVSAKKVAVQKTDCSGRSNDLN